EVEHLRCLSESGQRMALQVDRGEAVRVLTNELAGTAQLAAVVAQRMVGHREIPPVQNFSAVGKPSQIALGVESPQDFDRLPWSTGQPNVDRAEHLKLRRTRQRGRRLTQDP